MALTAALDTILKFLFELVALPFVTLAPLVFHPRIVHLVERLAAPLLGCSTGKAPPSAVPPVSQENGSGKKTPAQQLADVRTLPRDGTEEMCRGELLHRLRSNIRSLHDLLQGADPLPLPQPSTRASVSLLLSLVWLRITTTPLPRTVGASSRMWRH